MAALQPHTFSGGRQVRAMAYGDERINRGASFLDDVYVRMANANSLKVEVDGKYDERKTRSIRAREVQELSALVEEFGVRFAKGKAGMYNMRHHGKRYVPSTDR
ncbi:MAG: hypothetical protein WCK90_02820 [archaeon]